jgi:hypothetical protein
MDELFEALSNVHRRRLLVALLDHNPQRDDVDVPEDVHEGEKALETLQSELYHSHLPRLEEAGFIGWNRDAHEVVKGPRFDEIRPLLELMRDHADELPNDWL